MKSIDIRSESAVKLLAEFLDMDAPYIEGKRHVNAEHFAHGKPCTTIPHVIVPLVILGSSVDDRALLFFRSLLLR